MDDDLLRFCTFMARDPDGGEGCCPAPPSAGEPEAVPALKLDHIAVVVADLERAVHLFTLLGYEATEQRRMAGNLSVMMKSGESAIALFVPVSRHSDLRQFVATRGAGLQHIAFEAASLEQAAEVLGCVLEWEREPFVHAGLRMLWSKPDPTTGLVIELFERRAAGEEEGEAPTCCRNTCLWRSCDGRSPFATVDRAAGQGRAAAGFFAAGGARVARPGLAQPEVAGHLDRSLRQFHHLPHIAVPDFPAPRQQSRIDPAHPGGSP